MTRPPKVMHIYSGVLSSMTASEPCGTHLGFWSCLRTAQSEREVGLLEFANQLGNISQACNMMCVTRNSI